MMLIGWSRFYQSFLITLNCFVVSLSLNTNASSSNVSSSYILYDEFEQISNMPHFGGSIKLINCENPYHFVANGTTKSYIENVLTIPESVENILSGSELEAKVYCNNGSTTLYLPSGHVQKAASSAEGCKNQVVKCGVQTEPSLVACPSNPLKSECQLYVEYLKNISYNLLYNMSTNVIDYLTHKDHCYDAPLSESMKFNLQVMKGDEDLPTGFILLLRQELFHSYIVVQSSETYANCTVSDLKNSRHTNGIMATNAHNSTYIQLMIKEVLADQMIVRFSCDLSSSSQDKKNVPDKKISKSTYFYIATNKAKMSCSADQINPGMPPTCTVPDWMGKFPDHHKLNIKIVGGKYNKYSKVRNYHCSIEITICFPEIRTVSLEGSIDCEDPGFRKWSTLPKYRSTEDQSTTANFNPLRPMDKDSGNNIPIQEDKLYKILGATCCSIILLAIIVGVIVRLRSKGLKVPNEADEADGAIGQPLEAIEQKNGQKLAEPNAVSVPIPTSSTEDTSRSAEDVEKGSTSTEDV